MALKVRDIQLPAALKERLQQGHPWVYRDHVPPGLRMPSGSWVRARCGGWSGYCLWDDRGPIALRVFSEQQAPSAQWVRQRVEQAWDLRAPLRDAGITAYRWLFGEGDGLPGLTVDLYDQWAVIQVYMDGAGELIDWLADVLREVMSLRGIVLRQREADAAAQDEREEVQEDAPQSRVRQLWGTPPPSDLVVEEHGLRFYADLRQGQKTGLFLDQRENRRTVEGLSYGADVLNCFAYTGAFSLYALRGGARSVVSADIGKGLAEAAAGNIALNRLSGARHSFVTADCFELLGSYADEGRLFDLLILDPPSFAKSKRNRFAALRAYARLNSLALRCVRPGGLLVSSSCTSQIGPEAFKEMLASAGASAGRRLQIIHEAGQPVDHPVPAQFPEGRYLKFVVSRVSERA